jgi:hypothetical protein
MKPLSTTRRRVARDVARAGTAVSAAMLVLTVVAALGSAEPHASAATVVNAGTLSLIDPTSKLDITTGGATTAFEIKPPTGAACPGDTASGGYKVNSYLVPLTIDPATLAFNNTGPTSATPGFVQALYTAAGSAFTNKATAPTTAIINAAFVEPFSFGVFQAAATAPTPVIIPDGAYNVGIACTLTGLPEKYWNVVIDFKASGTNLGFTIRPATTPTTTTSTTSTTTTVKPGGSTTTTSTTTTTTVRPTSTTTTVSVASGSGSAGGGSNGGVLVSTGSSPTRLMVWAVLLLAFGRMAILFGRPIKVIPTRS